MVVIIQLYYEDFWGSSDEEVNDSVAHYERVKASHHFEVFTQDKKYMQRIYIEKKELK